MKTNLQLLRVQHGFKSARAFAEYYGFNVGTYTNLEQGVNKMSINTAWELADIFQVSLDELVGRSFKQRPSYEDWQVEELVESFESLDDAGKDAIMEQVEFQTMKKQREMKSAGQTSLQDYSVPGVA